MGRSERGKVYDSYISGRLLPGRWKAKCDAVRVRGGGLCERCGQVWMDQVHHLSYEGLLDEPLEDLIGLCRDCHKREHDLQTEDPLDADYGGADMGFVRWVLREAREAPQKLERVLQRLAREDFGAWFAIRRVLDVRLRHTSPYTR